MKRKSALLAAGLALLITAGATGCGNRTKKEEIAAKRDKWEASLKDTISSLEQKRDSLQKRIETDRDEVETLLPRFSRVDNPRYVEGFYIDSSEKDRYPLQATGITARLLDNESIEFVAACEGNRFTAIELSDGENSRRSADIAPDQALNYTRGNLTTVAFSGADADSIAMFILGANPENLSVSYLGSRPKRVKLSSSQAGHLVLTSRLWQSRSNIRKAEKELSATLKKLQIMNTRDAENGK